MGWSVLQRQQNVFVFKICKTYFFNWDYRSIGRGADNSSFANYYQAIGGRRLWCLVSNKSHNVPFGAAYFFGTARGPS